MCTCKREKTLRARCHSNIDFLQIGPNNLSLSDYWPFVNDNVQRCDISGNVSINHVKSSVPDYRLSNILYDTYVQVHECTRGCLRSVHDGLVNGHTNCTDVCVSFGIHLYS